MTTINLKQTMNYHHFTMTLPKKLSQTITKLKIHLTFTKLKQALKSAECYFFPLPFPLSLPFSFPIGDGKGSGSGSGGGVGGS